MADDPTTTALAVAALFGVKEVVTKLLGPTADYLGADLKVWTEKKKQNLTRIFNKSAKILGPELDEPGQVPPKVLKEILEHGAYCDDELASEYFAGVLASSRSEIPRDDRGAKYALLVSRLSSYEIKFHYLFYRAYKELYNGSEINLGEEIQRRVLALYIPFTAWYHDMDLSEEDPTVILSHVVHGLVAENLISDHFAFGGIAHMQKNGYQDATEAGIIARASMTGIELFLWALGKGNILPQQLLEPELEVVSDIPLQVLKTARNIKAI